MRYGAAVIACLLFVAGLVQPGSAQKHTTEPLRRWADARTNAGNPGRAVPAVFATVSDHFGASSYAVRTTGGDGLAHGGRLVETAGSGSYWVYDAVHHIAAGSEYGDVHGDRLLYASSPPVALPQRDLSGLVSSGGLHLGSTVADAVRIWRVPAQAVTRIDSHRMVLYARVMRRCGPFQCAHDDVAVFTEGHATSIALADIGP